MGSHRVGHDWSNLAAAPREEGDELKPTGNEEATLINIEQIHPELGKIDLYNASIFGHDL